MRSTDRLSRALTWAAVLISFQGCSVAGVVFDLPENTEEAEAGVNAAGSQALFVDTVRIVPPIELLSDPDSVLADLPADAAGGVDWTKAIDQGVIAPMAFIPGSERGPDEGFGFDFYFGAFETYFPHSAHVEWLACGSCHPAIFRSRDVTTSMKEISDGESCGACHGTVAFGSERCERCHPQAGMPEGRLKKTLQTDLVFTRDTTTYNAQQMTSLAPSIFPHWTHRLRYQCAACHPEPFAMEAGATTVTMDMMQGGQSCGACHDGTTAFGVMECGNCHTDPPEPIVEADPVEADSTLAAPETAEEAPESG